MAAERNIGRSLALTEVLIFFAGIAAPLFGALTGLAPVSTVREEKRAPAHVPALRPTEPLDTERPLFTAYTEQLAAFPRAFDRYFNDHFGYRGPLIQLHNRVKALGLGVSPSEDLVVGTDGWMFYAGQKGIEQYQSIEPFDDVMLDVWIERFTTVDEWLDDRGVDYIVFIAPAKPTIYSEYLPRHIRRIGGESRFDRLLAELERKGSVDALDSRPEFMRAKDRYQTYGKTDTHWTEAGAFVGYQILARALQRRFPAVDVLDDSDFEIRVTEGSGGDIAELIRLGDVVREPSIELVPHEEKSFRWVYDGLVPMTAPTLAGDPDGELGALRRPEVATERDVDGLPKVVMFHDSFGNKIIPYLGHSVQRGAYYWQRYVDPEIIDFERPDVVIQEVGERVLMRRSRVTSDEAILIDFERRREFRATTESLFTLDSIGAARDWRIVSTGMTTDELSNSFEIESDAGTSRPFLLRLELELTTPAEVVFEHESTELARRALRLRREIVYVRYPALDAGQSIRVRSHDPDRRFVVRALEARPVARKR